MEWVQRVSDIFPVLKNPPPLIGGLNPEPIERLSSTSIYNNGGNRRPFKVAYDLLMQSIVKNALMWYLGQHEHTESFEEFGNRLISQTNLTIFASPEILCSLVLCDLNVPSSNYLLLEILNGWDTERYGSLNFANVLGRFAEESVLAKKPKDKAPCYELTVHWADKYTKYLLVNFASFVAFRWYLRYLWKDLQDIPPSWQEPPSQLLEEWIEYVMKNKDRATSLRQFAAKTDQTVFCMPVVELNSSIQRSLPTKKLRPKSVIEVAKKPTESRHNYYSILAHCAD